MQAEDTMKDRKYKFTWDFIGNVELGRPHLGHETRIEVYRLFHYAMRDVLEEEYGTEISDRIFYKTGFLAGKFFCERFIGQHEDVNKFITKLQQILIDFNVGILRIEEADIEKGEFTLTVAEDVDCSGLPDMGHAVCTYDEGFIAGILYVQTGKEFRVREVDCWATGDRTCRFEIRPPSA